MDVVIRPMLPEDVPTSEVLSAPPVIATSALPSRIVSAALVIDWMEVAQARDTEKASISFGSPVPSTISRAMFGA